MAPEAQVQLFQVLFQPERQERVVLPSGAVIEGFTQLESGGAGSRNADGGWMTLGLHGGILSGSPPRPGMISLPDELDVDEAPLSSFGAATTDADLQSAFGDESPECTICRCEMERCGATGTSDTMKLTCEHIYHRGCLERWFKQKRKCPQCQAQFGKITGNQPRIGTMSWRCEDFRLPGYEEAQSMVGTYVIEFEFPSCTDETGTPFDGRKLRGYLPANCVGTVLLELFKVAFRRRIMFGLGTSMSFGTFRPTFNIHLKTNSRMGGEHGYPDDCYFKRSLEELRSNGVTLADAYPAS